MLTLKAVTAFNTQHLPTHKLRFYANNEQYNYVVQKLLYKLKISLLFSVIYVITRKA